MLVYEEGGGARQGGVIVLNLILVGGPLEDKERGSV